MALLTSVPQGESRLLHHTGDLILTHTFQAELFSQTPTTSKARQTRCTQLQLLPQGLASLAILSHSSGCVHDKGHTANQWGQGHLRGYLFRKAQSDAH